MDAAAAQSLTERTAGAAQWRLAGSVFGALAQFAITVALARLLRPADFGLVTLALFVIGLVRPIADLGIGTALVQRLTLNARHLQTAFTCCAILGLLVTAAIAIGAPSAARLAGNPGIVPILRLLAFGFALEGFAVVALSLLRRDLDFKKQFFIDTASGVLGYGGVSIVLALRHYGAWSLAWGALVQTVVASVARVAAARHPVRPGIGIRELKELLRFGIGAAGVSGVNYLALNGDDFVVGRWSGATALGFYNRAYGLMNVPYLYVTSVMSGVLFPAFAQAQTEPARLRRAYLVATRLTASIAGPILVGAAIAAPHLVRTLYGDRWPPSRRRCRSCASPGTSARSTTWAESSPRAPDASTASCGGSSSTPRS